MGLAFQFQSAAAAFFALEVNVYFSSSLPFFSLQNVSSNTTRDAY